jgi:hypothetical protein
MHDLKKAAACFYGDVKTMKQYKFASKINVLQKIANATMCYVPETLFVGVFLPCARRLYAPRLPTYRSFEQLVFTATTANFVDGVVAGLEEHVRNSKQNCDTTSKALCRRVALRFVNSCLNDRRATLVRVLAKANANVIATAHLGSDAPSQLALKGVLSAAATASIKRAKKTQ